MEKIVEVAGGTVWAEDTGGSGAAGAQDDAAAGQLRVPDLVAETIEQFAG